MFYFCYLVLSGQTTFIDIFVWFLFIYIFHLHYITWISVPESLLRESSTLRVKSLALLHVLRAHRRFLLALEIRNQRLKPHLVSHWLSYLFYLKIFYFCCYYSIHLVHERSAEVLEGVATESDWNRFLYSSYYFVYIYVSQIYHQLFTLNIYSITNVNKKIERCVSCKNNYLKF